MLYSQVYGTDDVAQFEQCVKPARLAVLAVLRPWQTNTTRRDSLVYRDNIHLKEGRYALQRAFQNGNRWAFKAPER